MKAGAQAASLLVAADLIKAIAQAIVSGVKVNWYCKNKIFRVRQ